MSDMMAARHLLIKFQGSRNPVSRRTGESTAHVTAEMAVEELRGYEDKIKSEGGTEEVFIKHATERSDCGSYKNGGDLGDFGPGDMMEEFEQAVLSVPIGSMTGIVLTDSGYHLIYRISPGY